MKRWRTRPFSSAAAFSVKVIASSRSTATPSSHTAQKDRSTSTPVFPLPPPACRKSEPLRQLRRLSAHLPGVQEERPVAALGSLALLAGQLHLARLPRQGCVGE